MTTAYRTCPAHCGTRVIYAWTRNNKRQVLDWMPDPTGNIAAQQTPGGTWIARTVTPDEPIRIPEKRYMPHWGSHPQCRPANPHTRQAAQAVRDELAQMRQRRTRKTQLQLIPGGKPQ